MACSLLQLQNLCLRQLICFSIATLYSGVWRVRWMRNEDHRQMWDQLGSFCLVVFVSSFLGALSIIMAIKMFDFQYESKAPGLTPYETNTLTSTSLRFRAAFVILFQVQVFLGIISKIMLLGRLSVKASERLQTAMHNPAMSLQDSTESNMVESLQKSWLSKIGRALPTTFRSV